MSAREVARLAGALALSAAAGYAAAWLWLLSKPRQWPEPLHLLDDAVTDGTIAGR